VGVDVAAGKVDGGARVVACLDHAVVAFTATRREAEGRMSSPETWCPMCAALHAMPRVLAVFLELRPAAARASPGLDPVLFVAAPTGREPARRFAWCAATPRPTITVLSRLEGQRPDRVFGVLAHEFGHALLFHDGHPDHGEQEADDAAFIAMGIQVRYDDDDVQTTGPGRWPRPPGLK
jgi:hypothetical protein